MRERRCALGMTDRVGRAPAWSTTLSGRASLTCRFRETKKTIRTREQRDGMVWTNYWFPSIHPFYDENAGTIRNVEWRLCSELAGGNSYLFSSWLTSARSFACHLYILSLLPPPPTSHLEWRFPSKTHVPLLLIRPRELLYLQSHATSSRNRPV